MTEFSRQQQFLNVIDRDTAFDRFQAALRPAPLEPETVPLEHALGRVLAGDVRSDVDVTAFDRSNVDGFAVRSADTYGATEESPVRLQLNSDVITPGLQPSTAVEPGTATSIATGAMIPRGADAVVMIEDTDVVDEDLLEIRSSGAAGQSITWAGTDIARGETVLRSGTVLSSREIGVLAAIGMCQVRVVRQPRVAVISTGNEVVPPGSHLEAGRVYDSNLAIISAAVEELGGVAVRLGIAADDEDQLNQLVAEALKYDVVILSGGTSKGAGDLSYRAISRLSDPGIIVHGVALKPGKPICLAVTGGRPVVILPGFPTSAIFTFHEFVAPVIRKLAGRPVETHNELECRLPVRVNSERGRTEYLLVALVGHEDRMTAWPMGKGSGSVTTFSHADGFITIDQHTEIVEAGETVRVRLIGATIRPADLVVIGSHCVGLDLLLGEIIAQGFTVKAIQVGSTGGLSAAQRSECDIAGIHLLHPESGVYNQAFVTKNESLISGYQRMQGIVFRPGDERFSGLNAHDALNSVARDSSCRMVNRNTGSGTRLLLDQLLQGQQPAGYALQVKSHNAVAAAVRQGRADWGLAITTVASDYELDFLPVSEERFDFVVPVSRLNRPAVKVFQSLLASDRIRDRLQAAGFNA